VTGPTAEIEERIRAFGRSRQGLGGEGGLLGALTEVVAVYSAQPSGPLSLAARVATFDPGEFAALEQERLAVRVPAMRSSAHLVPTATVARVMAATRPPLARFAWHLKPHGYTLDDHAALRDEVRAVATTPLTSKQLQAALGWSSALVRGVVQIASMEGTVVRVGGSGLRSNAIGWVSTDAWLGGPIDAVDPDDARAWLAGDYLRAFGPARVEDFAWWTSSTKPRAAAALAGVATVEVAPGLLLRAEDEAAFAAVEPLPPDHVDLLPVWDAYTMGYPSTGRTRFGPPEVLDRLYDDAGNGLGVVLAGGRAVGSWNSRFVGRTMQVDMEELAPWTSAVRTRVDGRLTALAELLGAADLEVVPVTGGARKPVGGKGNRRSYVTD